MRRSLVCLAVATLALGCNGNESSGSLADAKASAEPSATPTDDAGSTDASESGPAGKSGDALAAPSTSTGGEPLPAGPADVEEADPSKYPLHFIPTPATSISGTPKAVTWTKVIDLPGPLKSKRMVGGFLAQTEDDKQTYGVGEDGKPRTAEVEVPNGTIIGRYPDDAWHLWLDPRDSAQLTYQLRRLRGNGNWVPQDLGAGQTRDDLDQALLAKGWKAGHLVGEFKDGTATFWRASRAGVKDPDPITVLEGDIGQVFETKSGQLYYTVNTTRDGRTQTLVARSCEGDGCARETAMAFPTPEGFNSNWDLYKAIPRQRHSMSAIGNESRRPNDAEGVAGFSWLVHYEAGGWKLEQFAKPRRPEFLWPVEDGGLWVLVEHGEVWELWHRDPEGTWAQITLPEGFDASRAIDVSMLDENRVWIAGSVGGTWGIWETPAAVQAPPPPVGAASPEPTADGSADSDE